MLSKGSDYMVYGAISRNDEKYYTYLKKVFEAIDNKQNEYNWLITNCECYPHNHETDELFRNREYCWITGEELTEIISNDDFQWIWGILSGFDKSIELSEVLKYDISEDNFNVYFKNPLTMQHPLCCVEIVPFDSTFMMILSKDKEIINNFMKVYSCSQRLEEYNSK